MQSLVAIGIKVIRTGADRQTIMLLAPSVEVTKVTRIRYCGSTSSDSKRTGCSNAKSFDCVGAGAKATYVPWLVR
jgi:hypothetical protein